MKKALSLLLSLIMVFSLVPVAAFADGEPTISFETTFVDGMAAGDTFSVTASLANNPGIATLTLSLKWNEDAVKFNGFETEYDEDEEADVLASDVYGAMATVVNNELGILVGSRVQGTNTKKNGTLFTANFEIIGSGELEIGLKDADRTEFEMVNAAMEVIEPVIDYAAIANLAVAGAEPEGPAMPAGAPFTAITTDAGAVIAIEQQDDVNGAPYYIVTIPEDAETAYLTAPNQVVMEDWTTSEMQATAYALEVQNSWNQLFISYNYEESEAGPIVEIPMYMVASDWSGDVELCFVEDEDGYLTHAFGIEDANYDCLGVISFRYGTASEGGEEETKYRITVNQTTGGTVIVYNEAGEEITEAAEGDCIFVDPVAEDGYSFKQLYIDGEAVELGMTNGFYTMPAADITVYADFEADHTCVYNQETVEDKFLKSEATCRSGAVYYKSCTCGEKSEETFVSGDPVACVYVDGECKWCGAAEPVVTPGYTFATSADVSADNGGTAVVKVMITGHSDPNVTTYNAYDITLTFDSDKLEYQDYGGAVKSDNGSVTVNGNTIRIVGCGADKDFGTEIAALTFKTKAEGNANVIISKVQVSDKNTAVDENIPEATPKHAENDTTADTTPNESVILVPFSVTKPDYIDGDTIVLPGDTYEFSFADTENYNYTNLSVTIGGVPVEGLTPNEEGKYIIENVNGSIVISATQTAKSYNVTVVNDGATVNAPETATYGEVYAFTVEASEGKDIDTVKVTKTDDAAAEISYTINENGEYEIAGTDITADFTINVTQKDEPVAATTTITFTGVVAAEVEGGLTQTATVGQEFTFRLNKAEGFTYTAKVGETDLAETAATETVPAFFTIPADLVVEGGVTVTITKTEIRNLKVEVSPYFNTDGVTMFLVMAKDGEKVLSYGEEVMFYSSRYALTDEEAGAYCWLVSSGEELNSAEAVKAAAEAAIKTADATVEAPAVAYDCDVNQTNKVDVNDAQLAYDMYKCEYQLDSVAMDKFLEADMSTDKKLDVNDVAAIINIIVNGNNS